MRIVDCIQGSQEWLLARRGIPTASQFGRILTPKTMRIAAAAETYIAELVGETFSLTFGKVDEYQSAAMRHGLEQEPEARRWYELERGVDVQQVGFCLTNDGRFGCSPDGLVRLGDCRKCDGSGCDQCSGSGSWDGVLEMKNPSASVHVQYLLAGELPSDYKAQVHGEMLVTGRSWCDFLSYHPGLPPFLLRVERDSFTEKLASALDQFYVMYQEALAKIRAM